MEIAVADPLYAHALARALLRCDARFQVRVRRIARRSAAGEQDGTGIAPPAAAAQERRAAPGHRMSKADLQLRDWPGEKAAADAEQKIASADSGPPVVWLCEEAADASSAFLSASPGTPAAEGPSPVCWKYGSVRRLAAELIFACGRFHGRRIMACTEREVRLFGFVSSSGGTGCTTAALGTACELARFHGLRVLYLPFAPFDETERYFPALTSKKAAAAGQKSRDGGTSAAVRPPLPPADEPQHGDRAKAAASAATKEGSAAERPDIAAIAARHRGIREYLYYLAAGREEFCRLPEAFMVREEHGVFAFAPAAGSNPLAALEEDACQKLLEQLIAYARIDCLILDIGSSVLPAAGAALRASQQLVMLCGREDVRYGRWLSEQYPDTDFRRIVRVRGRCAFSAAGDEEGADDRYEETAQQSETGGRPQGETGRQREGSDRRRTEDVERTDSGRKMPGTAAEGKDDEIGDSVGDLPQKTAAVCCIPYDPDSLTDGLQLDGNFGDGIRDLTERLLAPVEETRTAAELPVR